MKTSSPDKRIDIRGLACPYTFVKAKLAIETMEIGQVLEILLDYEEAGRSIPRSMTEHGHTVVSEVKTADGYWILQIRKDKE